MGGPNRKSRGNALAKARISAGFTQEALAEKSGVSVKTIQLWEMSGTKSANVATLLRVAEALGADISGILC